MTPENRRSIWCNLFKEAFDLKKGRILWDILFDERELVGWIISYNIRVDPVDDNKKRINEEKYLRRLAQKTKQKTQNGGYENGRTKTND